MLMVMVLVMVMVMVSLSQHQDHIRQTRCSAAMWSGVQNCSILVESGGPD